MSESQFSRGHVQLARSMVAMDLTREGTGRRVGWDPGHVGKVLAGKAPGAKAMIKATEYVRDRDMWFQPATEEERAEMDRLLALINARSRRKGGASS